MNDRITAHYDRAFNTRLVRKHFGAFGSFGYWCPSTQSQLEACENLMEELLAFVPEKRGTILDVACGIGGTTRHLLKYYDPANVVGIDISEKLLARCRANAPGCTFLLMDAAHLEFPDNSFDTVLCVEGVPHFNTRETFLREAYRVLKPGGQLLLADIMFNRLFMQASRLFPSQNNVINMETYKGLYHQAGFTDALVVDATAECADGFYQGWRRMGSRELREGRITPFIYLGGVAWLLIKRVAVKRYLLISARKADSAVERANAAYTSEGLGRSYLSAIPWWLKILTATMRSTLSLLAQARSDRFTTSPQATTPGRSAMVKATTDVPDHDFQEISEPGFGDAWNTYPWSMRWWRGKLYVGTGRAYSCVLYAELHAALPRLQQYPPRFDQDMKCSHSPYDLPLQGEIWCYTPQTGSWDRVYQSPNDLNVPAHPRRCLPRDIGFRDMVVFSEPDGTESMYMAGVSARPIDRSMPPPRLLRLTEDGQFMALPSAPGTALDALMCVGFRALATYKERLYVTAGSLFGPGMVLEAQNPSGGDNNFRRITPEGMRVNEMAVFNGFLYLGLWHPVKGYAVVKTDTRGTPPYSFVTVVPYGGCRAQPWRSWGVLSMHVFRDGLYVGTDCPAELVRIHPDDTWDLIMGSPRKTPLGSKSPLSGMREGFDFALNMSLQRMQEHNGLLYAGTTNIARKQRAIPFVGRVLSARTGFDLYASSDGIRFSPITCSGFDNPANICLRTLESTPEGLFVGSVNEREGARIYVGRR